MRLDSIIFLLFFLSFSLPLYAQADSSDMLNFSEKPSSDPGSKNPVYTPQDQMFRQSGGYRYGAPNSNTIDCQNPRFNSLQRSICLKMYGNRNNENSYQSPAAPSNANTYPQQFSQQPSPQYSQQATQKPAICRAREYAELFVSNYIGNECAKSKIDLSVFGVNNDPCKWDDKDYKKLHDIYVGCGGSTFSDQQLSPQALDSVKISANRKIAELKNAISSMKDNLRRFAEYQESERKYTADNVRNAMPSLSTRTDIATMRQNIDTQRDRYAKTGVNPMENAAFIDAYRNLEEMERQQQQIVMLRQELTKKIEIFIESLGQDSNTEEANKQFKELVQQFNSFPQLPYNMPANESVYKANVSIAERKIKSIEEVQKKQKAIEKADLLTQKVTQATSSQAGYIELKQLSAATDADNALSYEAKRKIQSEIHAKLKAINEEQINEQQKKYSISISNAPLTAATYKDFKELSLAISSDGILDSGSKSQLQTAINNKRQGIIYALASEHKKKFS